MDRRSFLRGLGAIVGGVALTEAIPLGRVWSFPSKIVVPNAEACIRFQLEEMLTQIPSLFEGMPTTFPFVSRTATGADLLLRSSGGARG